MPIEITDIPTELSGLTMLMGRRPDSPHEDMDAHHKSLGSVNGASMVIASFQGQGCWERHSNGEELVQILEGETEGFVRIHTKKGTDRILGATLVAPHAGDLIGELSLAMTNRIGLGSIANAIHPYPTLGEAVRKVGDAYSKTRLTPAVAKLFKRWLAWRR